VLCDSKNISSEGFRLVISVAPVRAGFADQLVDHFGCR